MTRKTITAAALLSLAASGALAKAHDQGGSPVPGQDVKSETVTPAQSLGGLLGKRPDDKGPN